MEIINERSLEHTCRHGTTFKAERCDLRGGVRVIDPYGLAPEEKMADFMEFGAFHAMQIHPNLNGFSGYAGVRYIFDNLN